MTNNKKFRTPQVIVTPAVPEVLAQRFNDRFAADFRLYQNEYRRNKRKQTGSPIIKPTNLILPSQH